MSSTFSPITILEHTSHIHYITNNTDNMTSTLSPITVLEHTSHIHYKQHWPHVQYTQSNHYITRYVPHTLQTTLTTCPVRTVLSLYYIPPPTYETHSTDHMSSTYGPITILDPTIHLRNTHHWPHVQYVQSYHYSISHHLRTDHMSSTYSPFAILYPTIH